MAPNPTLRIRKSRSNHAPRVGYNGTMSDRNRLRINEIFHSIQGEGTRAGMPCVFVRTTGCHLRCAWCDTPYAFHEGAWLTLDEILAQVRGYGCPTVEVTGGEPLLQPATPALLARLADEFATVMIETSGALSITDVDPRVVRIVDLKCPGSGEVERNDWSNIDHLTPRDEVKFVIADRVDYEWCVGVVRQYELARRCVVLLSPVHGGLAAADLAAWMLADGLDARLGLQLHKFIWPEVLRGV